MMRILLAGDDARDADTVRANLREMGLEITVLPTVAARSVSIGMVDAIVVSDRPPRVDGPALCRSLRARGVRDPILLISSRRSIADRVEGLEAGADDYVIRPFAAAELGARIRALLRRNGNPAVRRLVVEDLALDPLTRIVVRGRRRVELTQMEFRLLEYLMRHSGRPVSRAAIGEHVWGAEWDGLTNVIDVFVCRLRKKLEPNGAPRLLHPVRGIGYLVASDAD